MGDFKKLKVWQKSHQLVQAVYSETARLAEGCGRRTDRELDRYVRISLGSAT